MSSAKFETSLRLELVPSRLLTLNIGLCHLLVLASLSVPALSILNLMLLGMLIIVSWVLNYALYFNARSPWFIDRLYRFTDSKWMLRTADGTKREARLLGCYVHPRLLILRFALGRFAQRSVVILPDSADPDAVRRLRVLLRALKTA